MSNISDFEVKNYDWLLDKFLRIYEEKWIDFVSEEYNNQPEPPDMEDR